MQALAQRSLKSTLDVTFAEVAVSDAELGLFGAENDVQASRARLTAALGTAQTERFDLMDEPLPPMLEPDPEAVVGQELKQRPDLAALQLSRDAGCGKNGKRRAVVAVVANCNPYRRNSLPDFRHAC